MRKNFKDVLNLGRFCSVPMSLLADLTAQELLILSTIVGCNQQKKKYTHEWLASYNHTDTDTVQEAIGKLKGMGLLDGFYADYDVMFDMCRDGMDKAKSYKKQNGQQPEEYRDENRQEVKMQNQEPQESKLDEYQTYKFYVPIEDRMMEKMNDYLNDERIYSCRVAVKYVNDCTEKMAKYIVEKTADGTFDAGKAEELYDEQRHLRQCYTKIAKARKGGSEDFDTDFRYTFAEAVELQREGRDYKCFRA